MFGNRNFGDAQLEQLYQQQQLQHYTTQLVYMLCTFTAALLLIALNHLPNPDTVLLLATVSAAFALALNMILNFQSHKFRQQRNTQIACAIWLAITVISTLPSGYQHGLLPVLMANFTLYTLFPFGLMSTVALCVALSLSQTLAFIIFSENSDFLLATILVHFWSNFIGIYLYSTRNRLCRAVFLNSRNAFSSQQEAQHEKIQSDDASAITAISGIPIVKEEHALWACHFAVDLNTMFRSFSNATTADLHLRIGISSGAISAGIIGARKWHYDVIGIAFDNAKLLEKDTKVLIEKQYALERIDHFSWRLLHELNARDQSLVPLLPSFLLFPSNQRRFSLVTISQAIHRILQSSVMTTTTTNPRGSQIVPINGGMLLTVKNGILGRRKTRIKKLVLNSSKIDVINDELQSHHWLHALTLRFTDNELEKAFHAQMDRWFIPALSIAILFLITFCQFITRTASGHTIATLLIMVVIFFCGIVNTFSCPSNKLQIKNESVCYVVYYSIISCVLWMLTCTVFVRFSSLSMLMTLAVSVIVYAVHIFGTHAFMFMKFSTLIGYILKIFLKWSFSWRIEVDMIIALISFVILIYIQARQNEKMIRLDFLSVIKTFEANEKLEQYEFLNEQILLNALPAHIAHHYAHRVEPYAHACTAVGVLWARFGGGCAATWQGAFGFDRLNRVIFEMDEIIPRFHGVEKIRSSHSIYTAAVGILPEAQVNVNDTPYTIGDLIASLTSFALQMTKVADAEGIEISIGIDCGAAMTLVIGAERPLYEIFGIPCCRAIKLMNANNFGITLASSSTNQTLGNASKILVSEEIFLALRPRSNAFRFNERYPLSVAPSLTGYQLLLPGDILPNVPQLITNETKQELQPPIAIVTPQNVETYKNTEKLSDNLERFQSVESESELEDSELLNNFTEDENQNKYLNDSKRSLSITLPSDLLALTRDIRLNGELCLQQQREADKKQNINQTKITKNPLEMFGSMNSSFSSELYSIDLSVETDSDIEWITPEMIAAQSLQKKNNGVVKASSSALKSQQKGFIPSPLKSDKEISYKGERARQYSDFSDLENINFRNVVGAHSSQVSSRMRNKRTRPVVQRNGPKLPPSWLGSSRTSCASSSLSLFSKKGSLCALDRLNQAARRELSNVDNTKQKNEALPPDCIPFPVGSSGSMNKSYPTATSNNKRREWSSSACHTEYDNAESEDFDDVYDAEVPDKTHKDLKPFMNSRLEELKRALIGERSKIGNPSESAFSRFRKPALSNKLEEDLLGNYPLLKSKDEFENNNYKQPNTSRLPTFCTNHFPQKSVGSFGNGNDADIDSNCSSMLNSNAGLDRIRWKSVHSIGYDNEYEFNNYSSGKDDGASDISRGSHSALSLNMEEFNFGAFVPKNRSFLAIDDPEEKNNEEDILDARCQVHALARDIRKNFGEYQLASFSDIDVD